MYFEKFILNKDEFVESYGQFFHIYVSFPLNVLFTTEDEVLKSQYLEIIFKSGFAMVRYLLLGEHLLMVIIFL